MPPRTPGSGFLAFCVHKSMLPRTLCIGLFACCAHRSMISQRTLCIGPLAFCDCTSPPCSARRIPLICALRAGTAQEARISWLAFWQHGEFLLIHGEVEPPVHTCTNRVHPPCPTCERGVVILRRSSFEQTAYLSCTCSTSDDDVRLMNQDSNVEGERLSSTRCRNSGYSKLGNVDLLTGGWSPA
eukprot:2523618-Rhodomonas_salina.1